MVSLTRSFNTNSGGVTFFSESVNMEDREYLQPILETYGVFKPVKTIPWVAVHLLYTLTLNVLAIAYAVLHPDANGKCREYFAVIYLHLALWVLTLVWDQVAKCRHHALRLNGYLDFYQRVQLHSQLPLYIVSLWNAALMLVQALMQHYYPDDFAEKCVKGGTFSPLGYMAALITVETCCLLGIHVSYITKVWTFNRTQAPPDVQKEEWASCAEPETFGQSEVGYRQLGDKVYDFLEKQANLIRHLKEHNSRLSEKLLIVGAQLQQARNAGNSATTNNRPPDPEV